MPALPSGLGYMLTENLNGLVLTVQASTSNGTGLRRRTAVHTFICWESVMRGWFEMDLVAHCGGCMELESWH